MKSFFDKFALNTSIFFGAMLATPIASADVAERYKKYDNTKIFTCRTRDDVEQFNAYARSRLDVAENERANPLPAPRDVNYGWATVTFEITDYADKSLTFEGLDKEGNIVKL